VKTASPVTIKGLTNGTPYNIKLRAVNIIGEGEASISVTSSPKAVPFAPVINTITPGDEQLTVDFTPGSDAGFAITNYEYSSDGGQLGSHFPQHLLVRL
jgi:hypothetical protein